METLRSIWKRFTRTRGWRAWRRYGDCRGNRLAGATTFFAFLSLFPLIVLAAAVTAVLLDDSVVNQLKQTIARNLPGIGDKVDLDQIIQNAGSIGVVSGLVLLLTGLGWIDSMRASIRSMWELDDQPGNPVKRKLIDLGVLVGLGVLGGISAGSTALVGMLSDTVVDWLGLTSSWLADWGLAALGYLLGVVAGAVMYGYLLSVLPRIAIPRRVLLVSGLVGGVIFVGAQALGGVYVDRVIGQNQAYGALALPLALLIWIYLLTRIMMLIAAWGKEATLDLRAGTDAAECDAVEAPPDPDAAGFEIGTGGIDTTRTDQPPPVPVSQTQVDTVSVAAGAVFGAMVATGAVALGRALGTVREAIRR